MALVGVGPGPVEHVLAVGVGLEVERHRRDEGVAFPQRGVAGRPARARGDAAGGLEAGQEGVGEGGLAGEGVPLGRGDLGEGGVEA